MSAFVAKFKDFHTAFMDEYGAGAGAHKAANGSSKATADKAA
jgi:hypothetical protein